jgi:hypothetical protein
MKISPVSGPSKVGADLNQSTQAAQDARARAIAVLTGGTAKGVTQAAQVETQHVPAQQNTSVSEAPKGQSEKTEASPSQAEVPAAAPPAKTEEPISSQYAVLARKEKAYRAKVQAQDAAFKAKEAALAEREAKLAAKDSSYETDFIPKSKLTEDTIQTLLDAGISYDKITEMALQQSSPMDPQVRALINELRNEIKTLKADTEGTKKSITEGQEQSYKQAVHQIKLDVTDLVKEGNDFEAIRETDSVQDVVDLIEKTYAEDKVLLTPEAAAKMVEEELVERISKYAKLSKIQQKFQPKSNTAPESSVQTSGEKQPQTPKTLTNGLTNTRQLSARERAILAFEGKLNKG